MSKKELFCKRCGNAMEDDGTCKMCPAGARRKEPSTSGNYTCPWDDHGHGCGAPASIKFNGGQWYCSRHFCELNGWSYAA